ncbi:MAG: hypothetical protein RM338_15605 [Nostoc sp. DedQUE12a]|nr:hypothetical protein [Nostoc sp. DedQUE12a]
MHLHRELVLANLIAVTATTAVILFLARLLDGITGKNASVAQAIISDVTIPEKCAQGFVIYGAALGLGFVLNPVTSLIGTADLSGFWIYSFWCSGIRSFINHNLFTTKNSANKS